MNPCLIPFQLIDEYLLIFGLKTNGKKFPHPPSSWNNGKKGDIVLIHGVTEPWNFLFDIGDYLNKTGYKIHIIPELKDNSMPLISATQIVKKYILSHHFLNLILVCHSKGGLIAYDLLSDSRIDSLVKLVITISSPFHGTHVGKLHPASMELAPRSLVIKKLETIKTNKSKIHAIHSRIDNHSIPHSCLHLEGAHNYQLDILGHTRILVSKKTQHLISQILKTP
jgi:alpha-beta hydrolase superfamily lysophospholipase